MKICHVLLGALLVFPVIAWAEVIEVNPSDVRVVFNGDDMTVTVNGRRIIKQTSDYMNPKKYFESTIEQSLAVAASKGTKIRIDLSKAQEFNNLILISNPKSTEAIQKILSDAISASNTPTSQRVSCEKAMNNINEILKSVPEESRVKLIRAEVSQYFSSYPDAGKKASQ